MAQAVPGHTGCIYHQGIRQATAQLKQFVVRVRFDVPGVCDYQVMHYFDSLGLFGADAHFSAEMVLTRQQDKEFFLRIMNYIEKADYNNNEQLCNCLELLYVAVSDFCPISDDLYALHNEFKSSALNDAFLEVYCQALFKDINRLCQVIPR